ncbi:hypothetical protein BMETH_1626_2 [methanotrophic bacterial endosymbiont of Bathymodiolus sp.]|nr:hypothetical protein BMETH_1626_2 [methanotrophic bacterial endosymbiont of Bathymodiolus sp.]
MIFYKCSVYCLLTVPCTAYLLFRVLPTLILTYPQFEGHF